MKTITIFLLVVGIVHTLGTYCDVDSSDSCDPNGSCEYVDADDYTGYICVCNQGYYGDGAVCSDDLNECNGDSNLCADNAACHDIDGCYYCTCNYGYVGDGITCNDIDECSESSLNFCHEHATCSDTDGCYECTCDTGYQGDGMECGDIDECDGDPPCTGANTECINTVGSFICICMNGYIMDGDSCIDDNECSSSPCDDAAECTNTIGSFTCQCWYGYHGDGFTCVDGAHYGESCSNGEQCLDTNTVCDGSTCVCENNYEYTGGACVFACTDNYVQQTNKLALCTRIQSFSGTVPECQAACTADETCLSFVYIPLISWCKLLECDEATATHIVTVPSIHTYFRQCSGLT